MCQSALSVPWIKTSSRPSATVKTIDEMTPLTAPRESALFEAGDRGGCGTGVEKGIRKIE